ncbi:MAG: hypothetical protein NT018_05240 [Armatimonadetes bacterium]|nr:hypothetical protein [Armatimonadota bacterium]
MGGWKHIAAVFDTDTKTARIYVDGLMDTAVPCPYDSALKLGNLKLGGGIERHGSFDGKIDDFRIYNWALAPENIVAVCQASER